MPKVLAPFSKEFTEDALLGLVNPLGVGVSIAKKAGKDILEKVIGKIKRRGTDEMVDIPITLVNKKYGVGSSELRNASGKGLGSDSYGHKPTWFVREGADGKVLKGSFSTKKEAIEWASKQDVSPKDILKDIVDK